VSKLGLLAHLPAALRRRLVEGAIGTWLRQHGATEGQTMNFLSGYRTKLVTFAALVGGLYKVVHGLQVGDQAEIGAGGIIISTAIGALGIRFAHGWTVAIGSAVAVLSPLSALVNGVASDFDIGAILHAWPQLLLALGIGAVHAGVNGDGPQSLKTLRARGLSDRAIHLGGGSWGSPLVAVVFLPVMLVSDAFSSLRAWFGGGH
jgi:hypothetical protein